MFRARYGLSRRTVRWIRAGLIALLCQRVICGQGRCRTIAQCPLASTLLISLGQLLRIHRSDVRLIRVRDQRDFKGRYDTAVAERSGRKGHPEYHYAVKQGRDEQRGAESIRDDRCCRIFHHRETVAPVWRSLYAPGLLRLSIQRDVAERGDQPESLLSMVSRSLSAALMPYCRSSSRIPVGLVTFTSVK